MFGLLHTPGAQARGAVVLCPPVGHEYMNAYSTFRALAIRLELLGFAALRFDYRSTGDSFDRPVTGGNAKGFVEDIRVAIDYVRALGLEFIAAAGMRLGASFRGRLLQPRTSRRPRPVGPLFEWPLIPS